MREENKKVCSYGRVYKPLQVAVEGTGRQRPIKEKGMRFRPHAASLRLFLGAFLLSRFLIPYLSFCRWLRADTDGQVDFECVGKGAREEGGRVGGRGGRTED